MSGSNGQPMIEAVGLSKYYGDFAAIDDISFQVKQGEVVAFLGPNGAGKSTTMKLLTGYLAPSKGQALIAGHDMAVDRIAGSTRLGYLPENGPLYCRHDAPQPAGILRRRPRHVAAAKERADRCRRRAVCTRLGDRQSDRQALQRISAARRHGANAVCTSPTC